jgi:hypothetical protein
MKTIIVILAMLIGVGNTSAQIFDNLINGSCDEMGIIFPIGSSKKQVERTAKQNGMRLANVDSETGAYTYATPSTSIISILTFEADSVAQVAFMLMQDTEREATESSTALRSTMQREWGEGRSNGVFIKDCDSHRLAASVFPKKLGTDWYLFILVMDMEADNLEEEAGGEE